MVLPNFLEPRAQGRMFPQIHNLATYKNGKVRREERSPGTLLYGEVGAQKFGVGPFLAK